MPKAFTLIELLVVITIIAVLAAILFPVFNRAKIAAEKTGSLTSLKQSGTAIVLYSSDYDDSFPLATPGRQASSSDASLADASGQRYTAAIPAGWDDAEREASDSLAWANSIQPYAKSYGILRAKGAPFYRYKENDFEPPMSPPYDNPRKSWFASSFTMNGLLSSFPATGVAEPSRLTLIWQGEGNVAGEGYANANPMLRCDSIEDEPCRFNPSGPPQRGGSEGMFGYADYWWTGPQADPGITFATYGHGMIYVATDTSARFRKNGSNTASTGRRVRVMSHDDPFAAYDSAGRPRGMWSCSSDGGRTFYRAFFRPDSTFAYQFGPMADCRIR
jgi:prepilin-type N-terminal cleavage/methylation domain-containing protein